MMLDTTDGIEYRTQEMYPKRVLFNASRMHVRHLEPININDVEGIDTTTTTTTTTQRGKKKGIDKKNRKKSKKSNEWKKAVVLISDISSSSSF